MQADLGLDLGHGPATGVASNLWVPIYALILSGMCSENVCSLYLHMHAHTHVFKIFMCY